MDTRRLSRSNLSRQKEEEESVHVHRITRGFGRIGGRLDDRKVEARRTRIRGRIKGWIKIKEHFSLMIGRLVH